MQFNMLPKIFRIFRRCVVALECCQCEEAREQDMQRHVTIMSLRDFGQCDSLLSRAIVTYFVLKIDFDDFRLTCLPENLKVCSVLVLDSVYGTKLGVSLTQKVFLAAKATYTCPKSHFLASQISYTSWILSKLCKQYFIYYLNICEFFWKSRSKGMTQKVKSAYPDSYAHVEHI